MSNLFRQTCAYLNHPNSPFSEGIRALRASIINRIKTGHNTFVVTSSWPLEGKTSVSLNLGASLTEFQHRTLIVDADFRGKNPASRLYPDASGLSNLNHEHQDLGLALGSNGPWLAARGTEATTAAQILQSSLFKAWLELQSQKFDVVLVDTPALSQYRDALWLGGTCRQVVLVASKSRFKGIPEGNYCEDLRDAGLDVVGIVATD